MYIKELEIDNFKSFASNIKIPFLEGFTTIAGPNGSGKSNIIDSVMFALGLSSSRTLRAEKISDVISTHNAKNEAFVKVIFSIDGKPENDVKIARRLKKTNQGYNSTYYLNDKVTTLTDVHIELERHNITPNSYNVIMQNDVMSITNCSVVERRKIIDEIAGVADFDRRIAQATNDLMTVEQRVEKSMIVMNEVDTRLEQLAQEREQALKYQKFKEEKGLLESQISTVKYFDIKKSIERLHESILDCNKKKKEEEQKLKVIETELAEKKTKYDEISAQVKEKGEAEQLEAKKQAEEIKGELDRRNAEINRHQKQIQDNLKTVENSKNGIEKQQQGIEKTQKEITQKQAEINELELKMKSEKAELSRILEEVSGLNKSADEYISKRNTLKKQLEEVKDNVLNLEREKIPLETDLNQYIKQLKEAKDFILNFETQKQTLLESKDRLEVEISELTKELEDQKLIQQNVMYELDKLKNELQDMSYNAQMAHRKLSGLEAQKIAFEEANLGRAIDTVMNANIDGVHAPLVQLGKVDKEYSTALEVAMGARMRNIVVDDEDVAKIAIEILKSSNAGTTTFLPLNRIKKASKNLRLPKDKGVIDFAVNLIDFDDIYTDAFYTALGETLVVEDYHCAKKLIGQYRMVTLTGEIFERSGAITGGSKQKSGLKFSQNQDDELETFKAKLKELESKIKLLEQKKIELEQKQEKVRVDYSNSLNAINAAKMEFANVAKQYEESQKLLEEKQALEQQLEPKIKNYETKLEKLELKNVELNENALNLDEEIKQIESSMGEDELKKLKEMTQGVESNIKKLETAINTKNLDIEDRNRQITFHEEMIKTNNNQIEQLLKDNGKLAQDKVLLAEGTKALEERIGVLNKKIEELGKQFLELQIERDSVRNEMLELEKQKNILGTNQERLQEQLESYKSRRKELEPELEEIKEELKQANINVNAIDAPNISVEEINSKIARLERKMDELGAVNMKALTEYESVLERQSELKERIETLTKERKNILEKMSGYEELKKETFLKTYNAINEHFKEVFTKLSYGEGTLVLENPDSPFAGGLTIEAQPRDKKKQRLGSMSGGEKTLTALAFVFAIQRHLPAPFYAFDEVDASLDGLNVERLAVVVKDQAINTQFVVVSHNHTMIESANRTIGVTQKEKGKTRVTGVKLRD